MSASNMAAGPAPLCSFTGYSWLKITSQSISGSGNDVRVRNIWRGGQHLTEVEGQRAAATPLSALSTFYSICRRLYDDRLVFMLRRVNIIILQRLPS